MEPTTNPTPREVRVRLNKMEAWFRRNTARFSPEDQVFLRVGFEHAKEPEHADVLAGVLREALPEPEAAGASRKKDCLDEEARA